MTIQTFTLTHCTPPPPNKKPPKNNKTACIPQIHWNVNQDGFDRKDTYVS